MLGTISTLAALKDVEQKSFEQYFDTLISNRNSKEAWLTLYKEDVARSRNVGERPPKRYSSRQDYKRKVARDFDQGRRLIRRFMARGIKALGANCYSQEAAADLLSRLSLPAPTVTSPDRMASVMGILPIIYDTTRDIGTASSVIKIHNKSDSIVIPAVNITSSFNITLTQTSRFLVRRTLTAQNSPAQSPISGAAITVLDKGGLFLRSDRLDLSALQRDARALFHLLGIWAVGEPFSTPPVDQGLLDSAILDTADGEFLVNYVTRLHKSGWCLFEALHEFGHILMGDWLLPPSDWTPDLEARADHFATCCLLLDNHDLSRVLSLRGACTFLRLLALMEQRFGSTLRHPRAWDRASWVEQFVIQSDQLDYYDTALFILTSQLDLLSAYCYNPTEFGSSASQLFGG